MNLADKKAELDALVDGFMVPIFQDHGGPGGRVRNGLGPQDFQRVMDGYACPDCLAKFKTYLVKCPVCGLERNVQNDIDQAPGLWLDHMKERDTAEALLHSAGIPYGGPNWIDQALADINADPDIEHTTMSKLKPRRRHKPAPTSKEQ